MEISNPLFSSKRVECVEKCLFCDKQAEKTNRIQQGWEKIQELAKEWKVLQIPVDDKMHHFTKLYDKIVDLREPFGVVHAITEKSLIVKTNHNTKKRFLKN